MALPLTSAEQVNAPIHPHTETLANSNQRADKGFATTFRFECTAGPKGKFRLDWIFVKASISDPRDKTDPTVSHLTSRTRCPQLTMHSPNTCLTTTPFQWI